MTRNTISPVVNNEQIENNTTKALDSPRAHDSDNEIFENILLTSTVGQRRRRTWATTTSFFLLLLVIGVLFLIPLWFTEALPKQQQLLTFLEAPPPPPPPTASPAPVKVVKVASNITSRQLRTPSRIPTKVRMINEEDAPPPVVAGGVVGGVPGGVPGGQLGGVIGGIISSTSSAAVPTLPKPVPTVQRVRVSQGVVNGLLINRVEPTYPPLAQQARIQGIVVLTAIIGKNGSVQHLQVVSGHPVLAPAAIAAVKQWRYKPYVLNGQALEVETTITVTFQVRS